MHSFEIKTVQNKALKINSKIKLHIEFFQTQKRRERLY